MCREPSQHRPDYAQLQFQFYSVVGLILYTMAFYEGMEFNGSELDSSSQDSFEGQETVVGAGRVGVVVAEYK